MQIVRVGGGPIITPHMDARMGSNVNGPSLIEVPPWVESPLGRYYLYFAHHDGLYIRLAVADDPTGPWHMHEAGVLDLAGSGFAGHIASPDVVVDHDAREIRLYFHGCEQRSADPDAGPQLTRVVCSRDGLSFGAPSGDLGPAYFRVFRHDGAWFAISMPGRVFRSEDGLSDFEEGALLDQPAMRHLALLRTDDVLHIVFSRVGDAPERLLSSRIALDGHWHGWQLGAVHECLAPELDYEGADCPLEPSKRGLVDHRVRQLRDPALFSNETGTWLLYAVAGESGIALARVESLD